MRLRLGVASFSLLLALGCAPVSEVIVELHTDFEPGIEFDEVQTVLDDVVLTEAARTRGYLESGVRMPPRNAPPGLHELTVMLNLAGRPVVQRSFSLRLEGTVVVPVWLVRACRDVRCPATGATECDGGRCVEPECVPSDGSCGEPACALDRECPAPAAGCAEPHCDEGNCVTLPVTGACASSEYCDVVSGCLPRPAELDAGRSDAGARTDGARVDTGVTDAGGGGTDAGGGGMDAPSTCGSCDDGNPCTDDSCSAGSCVHTNNSAGCSDGNACTHSDRCSGGSCGGTGYSCSAPPCMSASCDGSGGCSVGGGCGGGSVCDGSGCVPCGHPDEICCAGGACDPGLWCWSGSSTCTCGQPGGPCCWGNCPRGTCAGGTCPTCYPYGTSCDGFLPCCSGLCRGGVCFD